MESNWRRFATLSTLSCLLFVAKGQIPPRIVITNQPFSVDKAQPLNKISWRAPASDSAVYCISENPARVLGVDCPDCNTTDQLPWLKAYQDISTQTQFPTLMWTNVAVTKDMNGKTLRCSAEYQTTDDMTEVATAEATIEVLYMETPRIVDQNGAGADFDPNTGYHFFVECNKKAIQRNQPDPNRPRQQISTTVTQCTAQDSKVLKCAVDSNPPASDLVWLRYGAEVGRGETKTVSTAMIGDGLSCRADNRVVAPQMSETVLIDPWTKPSVYGTNFVPKRAELQTGGRIQLKKSIRLECGVMGDPEPTARWLHRDLDGQLRNASCVPQKFDVQPRDQANIYRHASACVLTMANYSYSGDYWCSACSSVAENTVFCEPSQTAAPSQRDNVMRLDVYGAPMSGNAHWLSTQDGKTVVNALYCADPALTQNQLFWIVGGEQLAVGQTRPPYTHLQPRQNGSNSECRVAMLAIDAMTEEERDATYRLNLKNQFGTEVIDVRMRDLGDAEVRPAGASTWWIWVLLALLLLLLLICLICCCCQRRRVTTMLASSRPKKQAPPPPEKNFAPNLAPQNYISEPAAIRPPVVSNGAYQQMPPPPPEKVDYGKKSHEGYNYAELDLVTDPTRPPPTYQPTDYAHLRQPIEGFPYKANIVNSEV